MNNINKQTWELRNLYINFIGNFGGNKLFGKYTCRLEVNIKIGIEGTVFSVLTVFML
jgi:hypothetical protein